MDMVTTMIMSYSYKPVFMLAFLDHMNEYGQARIEDVVQEFASFYEQRLEQGKIVEKRPCIFTKGGHHFFGRLPRRGAENPLKNRCSVPRKRQVFDSGNTH